MSRVADRVGTISSLTRCPLTTQTVSRTFGDSLVALMVKLRATEHHYIRCLKPNQTLKAADWDNDFMFKQLSYSGTLEVHASTARARCNSCHLI